MSLPSIASTSSDPSYALVPAEKMTSSSSKAVERLSSDFSSKLQVTEPISGQTGQWVDWIADPRPIFYRITAALRDNFVTPDGKGMKTKDLVSIIVDYLRVDLNEADKEDPTLNLFYTHKWSTYYGEVPRQLTLPISFEAIWQSGGLRFNEQGKAKYYAYYVPPTVDGRKLTANSMGDFAQHPLTGNASKYAGFWQEARREHGDKAVDEGYLAVIPTEVVGRNESFAVQKTRIEAGTAIPPFLAIIVANFTKYVWTGEWMHGEEPSPGTGVRCEEETGGRRIVVGWGSASDGLCVDRDVHDCDELAVLGLRKFFLGPRSLAS